MKKILFFLMVCMSVFLLNHVSAETKRIAVPLEGSPSFGSQNAPVTLVEFIDYQ